MSLQKVISTIHSTGVLLVFPIKNAREPKSIWSKLYPRKKMIWDWNEDSDNKISDLWFKMKKLSDSRKVIYSKWYQGRATYFSFELFSAMLRLKMEIFESPALSRGAKDILNLLEGDSPLSTKEIKKLTGFKGRGYESDYSKAMRELYTNLLIVAYGEKDDGSFPSLLVGATRNIFEGLLIEAQSLQLTYATQILDQYMPKGSLFRKFWDRHHRENV